MSTTQLQIEALVAATPDKVWDYWTQTEHIVNWNFASDDWQCPTASNDLKVGGKYSARMEAKDGSFGFEFEATYTEVILHQKISYTMEDGRVATTHFEKVNEMTKVTTLFDPENENPEELQKNGWQSILNNFKKYVEAN